MTATPVIHRVTRLDLSFVDAVWPFAEQRRADIDAYFARQQADKPLLFNGRVLLGRNPVFTQDCLSAEFIETDFASFLAWRDWGFPDNSVFNGFGMGALRGSDGAFVLGVMGEHTANAGRIYFAAGTPEPADLLGETVDLAGSVAREVEEEIGLCPADYRAADHWDCVVVNCAIAMMRVLDVDRTGAALRAAIEANLAGQSQPELSGIHLVRQAGDLTSTMPLYVRAFLEAQLAGVSAGH